MSSTVPLDAQKAAKISKILQVLISKTGIHWKARLDENQRVNVRFLGKNIWVTLDDADTAEDKADKVVRAMYSVAMQISPEEFDFLTRLRQASAKPAQR